MNLHAPRIRDAGDSALLIEWDDAIDPAINARAIATAAAIRGAGISVHPDAEDLTEIAHLIDAGKIKPIVTQVLPLSEAVAAQRQAATHHTRGKVVLRVAADPKS